MSEVIMSTKPRLSRVVGLHQCKSFLYSSRGLIIGPRCGWSAISKEKAYENWKLAVTGGDWGVEIRYLGEDAMKRFDEIRTG